MNSKDLSTMGRTVCKSLFVLAVLSGFYFIASYHNLFSSHFRIEELRTDLLEPELGFEHRRIDMDNWCSNANKVRYVDYQTAEQNILSYDWMYTPEYKLFYCSAPKVASTTMKKSLMESIGIKVVKDTTAIHRQAISKLSLSWFNRKTSAQDIPLARSHRNPFRKLEPTKRSLIIVRNPYERLISAYQDKIVNSGDVTHLQRFCNYYAPALFKNSDTYRQSRKDNPITFSEYIDCVLSNHLLNTPFYNDHIVPMSKLCAVCLIRYDMIVKMENFIPEIAYTLTQLDGDTDKLRGLLLDKRRQLNPTKSHLSLYRQLNQQQLDQLKLMYQDDFELFGYSPEIPFE